jgi:hypothetical protein
MIVGGEARGYCSKMDKAVVLIPNRMIIVCMRMMFLERAWAIR